MFMDNGRSNTDEFIRKAKLKHGDKYDYSNVCYITAIRNVIITCKIHGNFSQSPNNHLGSQGCPICANENRNNKANQRCKNSFISKVKIIHNDFYDYSLVDYKKATETVDIICPVHGIFKQTPNSHLNGSGCRDCANDKLRNDRAFTKETFIEKAILVHGNKYDYSLVNYYNARNKVDIICPIHGLFEQAPHLHLRGENCPSCRESVIESRINVLLCRESIIFIREKTFPNCKIKRCMKFDFFIPSLNLIIEYHGSQHFIPWDGANRGFTNLMITRRNDEYKKRWAIENGYEFKEYNYKQSWAVIEKDIKKLLK
jgi:hypothetical protein